MPVIKRILTYQYLQGGGATIQGTLERSHLIMGKPCNFPPRCSGHCPSHNLPMPDANDSSPEVALAATAANQEPMSYQEAVESNEAEQRQAAMQAEIGMLHSFPMWELVSRSQNCRILKGLWVYKKKVNSDGTINKYRARFIMCRYTQEKGVNFH